MTLRTVGIAGRRRIIAVGNAFVYLTRASGKGEIQSVMALMLQLLRDREGPHLDELARLRPHDGGAEDATTLGRHDLDVADGLALGLGPIVLVIGPAQHVNLASRLRGLGLRQADTGAVSGSVKVTRGRRLASTFAGCRNRMRRMTIPA